jgi:hypothetical protein
VRPGSARENQRLQEASGRVWAVLRFDSVESESRGGAECAVTPQCAPPTLFSHGLGPNRWFAAVQRYGRDGMRSGRSADQAQDRCAGPIFGSDPRHTPTERDVVSCAILASSWGQ